MKTLQLIKIMCLTIKNRKKDKEGNLKPLIAKKDIICYKKLKKTWGYLMTPFQDMSVRIGQVLQAPSFSFCYGHSVERGIHAYTSKKELRENCYGDDHIGVLCTIPKGTPYFRGRDNDIVALKMKINKTIYKNGKFL